MMRRRPPFGRFVVLLAVAISAGCGSKLEAKLANPVTANVNADAFTVYSIPIRPGEKRES